MLTTLKPGYYLGIDGGGTKTEAVITTESGFVLGRGKAGGANPHNIPLDVAHENVRQAVKQAAEAAHKAGRPVDVHKFESMCLGLAGIDTQYDRDRVTQYINAIPRSQRQFDAKRFILCNDGFIGLKSATDENWGICMISSTGSNCYGVNQLGREATAGDWGYLLGDQGSGYVLGLKILHRVIKEYDGRRPLSKLTPIVLKHLGLKQTPDLIPWAYGGQPPIKDIASLTTILNDPELEYSLDLEEYLMYTIRSLIDSYKAVVHRLKMHNEVFPVVLIGGLFNLKVPFRERVTREIQDLTPQVRVMSPMRSPAEGAVRVAMMGNLSKLYPESVITFIDPE